MITSQKMTEEEKQDWLNLCKYVHREILEYDENMKFPRYLAVKLKGLQRGQYVGNNTQKRNANYDCKTLLYAFKLSKTKIVSYLHNNESKIKDEKHRINIIVKIVEPEINDVYIRLQQLKNAKDKVEHVSLESQSSTGAEYTHKTKEINEKMKKLF
jgi:hypothetical protein